MTSWRSVTGESCVERRLDPRERGLDGVVGDDGHGVDVGQIVGAREGRAAALPRRVDGVASLQRLLQHRGSVAGA